MTEDRIVDCRRFQRGGHTPVHIKGAAVDRVTWYHHQGSTSAGHIIRV